jgi:MAP3K TRAFs-binding domain
MKPLCFILMPFGIKTDGNKKEIDFDKVYNSFIKPAIIEAGLDPIRADEEKSGGFIHKPMYERLMFCNFAVADLSFANANVFYELGIRHALKPFTTISIFDIGTKLPFDTAPLRTFPYNFTDGFVEDIDKKTQDLAALIKANLAAPKAQEDSPIAQLIAGYKFPDLEYLQKDADAFADWVATTNNYKTELTEIVKQWKQLDKEKGKVATADEKKTFNEQQDKLVDQLIKIQTDNAATITNNYDLLYAILNAYKSVSAFAAIVAMLKPLVSASFKDNIYIKQQLGLAYNKIKERESAIEILSGITDKYGADPETNGLIGAAYKGMMDDNKDDELMAQAYCEKAIDAYIQGFEADPRDYYPGINALTLLFFNNKKDERFKKFMPLVNYAVERQLASKAKDYWVQATALELAALDLNETTAKKYVADAIICKPDNWMKETTAKNLKRIYDKALVTSDADNLLWLNNIISKLS